jgi:1-acyl-sn-glycerol-3-phosphate acyltransferase
MTWRTDSVVVARPGVASPAALWFATRVLHRAVRLLHRATLEGVEHLPVSGPFLLVANHSGGLGIAEINSFIALYAKRFGASRPIAGFAHPLGFEIWPLSRIHPHLGTIPSTYAAAEATLAAGVPILVFPGGDHESMRPIWQAYRVDFGGRKGFLRIARKAGVPILPLGIRGSHLSAPPLVRSRLFTWMFVWPSLVGVKRYAVHALCPSRRCRDPRVRDLAWPWRALLAWAWAGSPLAFVPWIPWTIRMRIGPALMPETLFGTDASATGEAVLEFALRRVETEIQSMVDQRAD